MKEFKRFLCIFLVVVCTLSCFSNSIDVLAKETDDYKTFAQNDTRWADVKFGSTTVAKAGCYITSICVQMAYANPDLRDVDTFNPGVFAGKSKFDKNNNFIYSSTESFDKKFSKAGSYNAGTEFNLGDVDKVVELIVEKEQEGYYVIVEAGKPVSAGAHHWSPVTGIDDEGKPVIIDVNVNQATKEPMHDRDTWLQYIDCIQYWQHEDTKSYEMHEARLQYSGSSNENLSYTEDGGIYGMDQFGSIIMEQQETIVLPDQNYLNQDEKSVVAEIKNNTSVGKKDLLSIFSLISKFIGLLIFVYIMLLITATILDKVNVWVDISLVKVLTFGRCELCKDDADLVSGNIKSVLTIKQIAIRVLVLFVIGLVLLSNLLVKFYVFIITR